MGLPGRDPPRYSRAVSDKRTWTRSELPAALERALDAATERGAKAPVILRLTEIAGYTDWVMLVSARSERQVRGVVDGVTESLVGSDARLIGSDGLDHYLWALLDYDDFLIHVFYHPVRKHYDLESMWSDAPRVELELPPEVQAEIMDISDLEGLAAPEPMPSYRGDLAFGGFDDEFVDEEFEDDQDFEDDELEDDDELFDGDDEPAPGAEPTTEAKPDDDLFEP
ncbi:MAG TPA: ribosome silencing factor [Enhygromyxa sp.]|nr:ribosome silencing factor [Enhygromyxa sp.]